MKPYQWSIVYAVSFYTIIAGSLVVYAWNLLRKKKRKKRLDITEDFYHVKKKL